MENLRAVCVSIDRQFTATGGRAAGAWLLHRDGEAVALEGGAVVSLEAPLHVETDAVDEGGAARDLEVQRAGTAIRRRQRLLVRRRQHEPGRAGANAVRIEIDATQHGECGVRCCVMDVDCARDVERTGADDSAVGATPTIPAPWPAIAVS